MNKNYILYANRSGYVVCKGIPEGWKETTLNVDFLKKFNIPVYQKCSGIIEYKDYHKLILKNIIPADFAEIEKLLIRLDKKALDEIK